ncbi:hypothetical protein OKA05_27095 [Luteolibacter arcticus]|uniref:Uncharacterized protein n=1 Tax=Luteolibacter arcticus TaxID=1581411 RepID=A0ABT3GRX3_9BACT|nr:hypothetical protein [Luteolibacter arcticus]MCW1926250.1 hypothetical protein [Luteolibacter arcticus]
MDCTDIQKQQIEVLLGYVFHELQLRCSQRNLKAIAALAYACHNLPSAYRNPHFDLDYFRQWFGRFHDDHGFMYDYLSMLDAIRDGAAITGELAIGKWGEGLDAWPIPEPPALTE